MEQRPLLVKVCGINRQKNLNQICRLSVDMIGLNFYLGSKRYINNISINIKPNIKKVGVFVEPIIDELVQYTEDCKLDYFQLHGEVSVDFCESASSIKPVIKSFGVDEAFDFDDVMPFSFCPYFLFDTKSISHGGSGKKFDWEKLNEYQGDVPFLLAGGIGPDDVERIKKINHPQFVGVDINSRFEIEPGLKNVPMVEEFIDQIKS